MHWEEPTYFSTLDRKHMTRWTSLIGHKYDEECEEDDDALVDLRLTEDDMVQEVLVWDDTEISFSRKFKKSLIGKPMKEAQDTITAVVALEGFV